MWCFGHLWAKANVIQVGILLLFSANCLYHKHCSLFRQVKSSGSWGRYSPCPVTVIRIHIKTNDVRISDEGKLSSFQHSLHSGSGGSGVFSILKVSSDLEQDREPIIVPGAVALLNPQLLRGFLNLWLTTENVYMMTFLAKCWPSRICSTKTD